MPDVMSNLLECYIGEVKNLFGGSLRQVILYGSYARGDYREDSDVDTELSFLLQCEKGRSGIVWSSMI